MYQTVDDIRKYFINELENERFTQDRTGQRTIELLGASFVADEPAIFGTPNEDYIDREIEWYESCSTNIYDIYGEEREPPKAWRIAANQYGEINSNYGHLVFSPEYYCQFSKALYELIENPDSRRACMIYNRPSIWFEAKQNGKNDFICTNAVTYYIRDGLMHCVVQMRSNDVVFGYKNDFAWQRYALNALIHTYNTLAPKTADRVKNGNIYWQVQNLHVYERHFHLVKE
jgi:thymidylate synthase